MSAIKKFFQKKKLDVKFKQAGQGHKLTASQANKSDVGISVSSKSSAPKRLPSAGSSRAASAALARFDATEKPKKHPTSATTTWKSTQESSKDASTLDVQQLKLQVKEEIAKKRIVVAPCSATSCDSKEVLLESSPAATGFVFACPVCPVSLPEHEINRHIEQCLYGEIDSEPCMIAASMIHTLNAKEKVEICVEMLNKYLDNIIRCPNEEKYRKIKQSNKVFKDRVAPLKGVKELLTLAIGFVEVKLPISEDGEEEENFYILSEGLAVDNTRLEIIKSYINEAEPLQATLDRNIQVLEPAAGVIKFNVPDNFYSVSNDELKKEHKNQAQTVERNKQLRTKAMRDSDELAPKRHYRFTLIRVRFPDGIMVQGTFYSKDLLSEVQMFLRESIEFDWLPFELLDASGKKLTEFDKTLESLQLSPAAILKFQWDPSIASDVRAANASTDQYLSAELLSRKTPLY